MKLPEDSTIAPEKVSGYLLVKQPLGDKSAFLALAGYLPGNADQLLRDLKAQALAADAIPMGTNEFGQMYEVRCDLRGPNGKLLAIRTIWMREHLSGITKFITLIPDRRVV